MERGGARTTDHVLARFMATPYHIIYRLPIPQYPYREKEWSAVALGQLIMCWRDSWPPHIRADATRLIIKPSYSGSGRDIVIIHIYDVAPALRMEVTPELRRVHSHVLRMLGPDLQKPCVLVQPVAPSLLLAEYRLFYVAGKCVGGVATALGKGKDPALGQELTVRPLTEQSDLLSELQAFGYRVHSHLPKCVMWRVDVFRHLGTLYVNEIEMVDAQLFLDWHGDRGAMLLESMVDAIAGECIQAML